MPKEPPFKLLPETPDLTRLSSSLERDDLDKSLMLTAQVMVGNLKHCVPGTKEYIAAIANLGKLLIEIKKIQPKDSTNKDEALAQIEAWLARAKGG
jgi:hypothetical protein